MSPSDIELLRQYTQDRSEEAFAELVRRHIDFVYAAAKRQLGSAALAEDIAQSVFFDLARNASSLRCDSTVIAWLHLVTRRTAVDMIRHEARRREREKIAAELHTMETSPDSWPRIAPVLDEALTKLDERDRMAVLLRFFENKPLREIGTLLGISDDAAQKRITRALEKLRHQFGRRGIALTSTALLAEVSAHAIETAPTQLGATISSFALTHATAAVGVSSSAQAIAMTTMQKIIGATLLVAVLGGTAYEARVIAHQNRELETQRLRVQQLENALDAARREREVAARELATAREALEIEKSKSAKYAGADPAVEAALDTWLQNVVKLKAALDKTPWSQIPELQFLTAKDWLDATKENPLNSDLDIRRALSQLRIVAKMHFAGQMAPALNRYLKANANQPPTDPVQLAPFFEPPTNSAILDRYALFSTNDLADYIRFQERDGSPVKWIIREKRAVDPYYDTIVEFSSTGFGYGGLSEFQKEVNAAVQSFSKANNQARPVTAAQVQPYIKSAIDPAFIQTTIDEMKKGL